VRQAVASALEDKLRTINLANVFAVEKINQAKRQSPGGNPGGPPAEGIRNGGAGLAGPPGDEGVHHGYAAESSPQRRTAQAVGPRSVT